MALRWMEGFETDHGTTDFQRKYQSVVNSGTWAFTTGPKVGSAMQPGGNADAELRTKTLVAIPTNIWITGWRILCQSNAGAVTAGDRTGGLTLFRGTSDQVEIRIHSNGTNGFSWRVYRGATLLGESATFWADQWFYWEFKVSCRTGTNGSVQIRQTDTYHGGTVTFYSLSGINTANSGTDGADTVRFKFQFGTQSAHDDIYINDDSGAKNNDYESGDVVIFGSSPNGDGHQTDWTPSTPGPHFSLVNDPAGTPSDTTKVKSQVPGQIDLYDYQNLLLVSSGQPILGVLLMSTGGMETSGSRTLRQRVRSGSSEAFGSNFSWSTTPAQQAFDIFEQNPVTASDWTKTDFDAAQFGIELVS